VRFNFDGEFCVGNRGMIEFIEALKLEVAFLYDLLGASQEQCIKPKKFAQVMIDEAIFAHTNTAEYEKLKSNQYMEALRDRTVKINVPYTLKWQEEIEILEKDYGPDKVRQHVAPHTLEIAALWSVLTRLQDDKDGKLSLVEKAELYNGKLLAGWTEDSVKELKDKYPEEGMAAGVSVRYVQDKISNCLSNNHEYVNMFMVLNELRDGLYDSSLLDKEKIGRYTTCIDLALKKLTEILKHEVQKALVGDEDAIIRLCTNYIDNVMAYINKSKVKNKITGQDQKPDERLMRAVEEKIEIPEQGSDDFRRQIAAFIGDLAHKKKEFKWDSNPKLKKALEMKLFEDVKDTIKLSALNVSGASVVDKDIQEKIDALKSRLIKQYGYNERSATDVLDFVGGIFARGDLADE
jgi:serine protein kinase